MNFERRRRKFACRGIFLDFPVDLLPEGKYPFLQNVHSVQDGTIETRPGLQKPVNTVVMDQLNVHSVRRMNNALPGATVTSQRFIGAGTKLYTALGGVLDTGFSGNPLSMLPYRPEQSTETWMYVFDSVRMRKCRIDGITKYPVGIVPPNTPPVAEVAPSPAFTVAADFAAVGSWAAAGTAGAPAIAARAASATTIGSILFDTGSTGWATFSITNASGNYGWLGVGARLVLSGTETVTVQEVHSSVPASTVAGILYDSGTTGACCIQSALPTASLDRNSLLTIGTEVVRVLSVTKGPDGLSSLRCVTVGTISAGNTITGLPSVRCYCANTHAAGDTVVSNAITSTVTAGIGTLTLAGAIDLSQAGGRPLQPEDYLHLSFQTDQPGNVIEGKLQLDFDSTTNDFTRNYFTYSFRPSDATPALLGTATTISTAQTAAQLQQIEGAGVQVQSPDFATNPAKYNPYADGAGTLPYTDAPGNLPYANFVNDAEPLLLQKQNEALIQQANQQTSTTASPDPGTQTIVTQQLYAGNSAWTEILIKISDLQRVGSDRVRGLQSIASIRLSLNVTATTVMLASAWWVGGGYGPDTAGINAPLLYRYRYRSSVTGAKSIPSPAIRTGLQARRQQINLSAAISSDTQVDKVDFERFGGANTDWHYVGTRPNDGSSFADIYLDNDIIGNRGLETDAIAPFPVFDVPRSGTATVVGTSVLWVSGDTFNTSWAPGTQIRLNGVPYTLYGEPSSTTRLQVFESAGNLGTVQWIIEEPIIMGSPLPVVIGPFDGFFLAMGDPRNPGMLRFTKGNDPDSAPIKNYIEVTPPSDPLVGGVVFAGRCVVWSSTRAFDVRPSGDANIFTAQELSVGKGLFSPWACCSGNGVLYFMGEDGVIYQTEGGPAMSLTEDDLRPLFRHDGVAGVATNGLNPPDITKTANLRLSFVNQMLYFDYLDTAGAQRTLMYNPMFKSWLPYVYTPGITLHYQEEGQSVASILACGSDGNVYPTGGSSDNGFAIACTVQTAADDFGDSRAVKLMGDAFIDVDAQGTALTTTFGYDNFSTTASVTPAAAYTSGRSTYLLDITGGLGTLARNIGITITWSSTLGTPKLFEFQPSFVPKVETSLLRAEDWTDGGQMGAKYVRGCLIEGDTLGATRTVQAQYDGGTVGATFSVTHAGQQILPYAVPVPFTAHLLRLVPTDSGSWRNFRSTWIFDPYPELAAIAQPFDNAGTPGRKFVQGMRLTADGTASIQIYGDNGVLMTTISAAHTGQTSLPYYWTPFTTHTMQLVPLGPIRIMSVEWIYEPVPELATIWQTQGTSHGLKGYQHARDGQIALLSTAPVTPAITVDGVAITPISQLPSTNGVYAKLYTSFPANKGKIYSYGFTSTAPFSLYVKDCEIRVKEWGSSGPYLSVKPFGDIHFNSGARI